MCTYVSVNKWVPTNVLKFSQNTQHRVKYTHTSRNIILLGSREQFYIVHPCDKEVKHLVN